MHSKTSLKRRKDYLSLEKRRDQYITIHDEAAGNPLKVAKVIKRTFRLHIYTVAGFRQKRVYLKLWELRQFIEIQIGNSTYFWGET